MHNSIYSIISILPYIRIACIVIIIIINIQCEERENQWLISSRTSPPLTWVCIDLIHNRISYVNQIYFCVIRAPVVGLMPPIGNRTVFLEVRTRYNRVYFMVALAYILM
jgi:hypothetical protein